MATELRALMSAKKNMPATASYVIGLGGRDVTRSDFKEMVDSAPSQIESGRVFDFFGVKED